MLIERLHPHLAAHARLFHQHLHLLAEIRNDTATLRPFAKLQPRTGIITDRRRLTSRCGHWWGSELTCDRLFAWWFLRPLGCTRKATDYIPSRLPVNGDNRHYRDQGQTILR